MMYSTVVVLALALAYSSSISASAFMFAIDGRIINGEEAAFGFFPHQVGLGLHLADGNSWCGGSLIAPNWVLTAAHCTSDVKSVTVFLGSLDLYTSPINITVGLENVFTHEHYDRPTLSNDIALVKIPSIAETDFIKSIKLASPESDFVGEYAITSGWGFTIEGSQSQKLLYGYMVVIDQNECSKYFGSFIKDFMICVASQFGVSTCFGDSGGPLIVKDGEENVLIGVTSFVSGAGCDKGYPAAFTRVTSYLKWIEDHTGIKN